MTTLVAQLAPQRSTQYADLVGALAEPELQLSPLGEHLSGLETIVLGGQSYLRFTLPAAPDESQRRELGWLAMSTTFFTYFESLAGQPGPFLKPLETGFEPALPPDLITTRRYRGKTNELFTHFLCNIARYSSRYAGQPWPTLRVFDPLAGGGTTLFTALVLGADAAGVEGDHHVAESTAGFLKQYMRHQRIACREERARLKQVGRRWTYRIGRGGSQQCLIGQGETADSLDLLAGFKAHLVVTDLPYGVQHRGQLTALLERGLPVWSKVLRGGGALALAWEPRTLPRTEMTELIQAVSPLTVLSKTPYDALTHRVDRVIKARDVLVARK